MSMISIEILKKNIPFFDVLLQIQQECSAKIYIVGGCIRDILLNKKLHDIDIAGENIEYTKLAKILSKKLKTHAVPFKDNMRLMKNNLIIDVSKLRGSTIYEDVQKRDFTINNLACSLEGSIIGDIKDIENKTIKAVYSEVFDDDPLRIVRAVRFAATLGFNIDEDTLKLAVSKNSLLKSTAKERVLEEFRKMFQGKYIDTALHIITSTNLFSPLVNTALLDNEKLLKGITLTSDFCLLLCLWCKDSAFIEYLGLTVKEQKNAAVYLNIDYERLKKYNDKELKYFIFKNSTLIADIIIYITVNFNDASLAKNISALYKTLDFESAKKINGSTLLSLGFKPSPLFSEIIDNVSFLLAIGDLNKDNIEEYIKNRWC